MYAITAVIFVAIFANYLLGYKLYGEPKNKEYFSNVNNYNTINKRELMASPKYVVELSIFIGIFIGLYLFLSDLQSINWWLKWVTILIIAILFIKEITQKITITEDELVYEKFLEPTKRIQLNSIDGMYIYSYNKKFLNKRALTTKLIVCSGEKKYKLLVSALDVRAILNMMKENFGINEHKMFIDKKEKNRA
jgi:hypothetical protein